MARVAPDRRRNERMRGARQQRHLGLSPRRAARRGSRSRQSSSTSQPWRRSRTPALRRRKKLLTGCVGEHAEPVGEAADAGRRRAWMRCAECSDAGARGPPRPRPRRRARWQVLRLRGCPSSARPATSPTPTGHAATSSSVAALAQECCCSWKEPLVAGCCSGSPTGVRNKVREPGALRRRCPPVRSGAHSRQPCSVSMRPCTQTPPRAPRAAGMLWPGHRGF